MSVVRVPSVMVLGLVFLGAGLVAGCDRGTPDVEVSGIVTSVDGSSPTQVSQFTLRTSEGRTYTFEVGQLQLGGNAFPAGHLREHQATAQPVRVTYREEGSRLVAVRLRDGP